MSCSRLNTLFPPMDRTSRQNLNRKNNEIDKHCDSNGFNRYSNGFKCSTEHFTQIQKNILSSQHLTNRSPNLTYA